MKLLSLGAIAMDIVINSHELPKDDGFALVNHEEMLPGGSASNVSVSAGHLGLEVYQTGKIGDDAMEEEFRKTLVMDGVDDRYVVTKEGGTTLHTYILTAPGGKHCIFANKRFSRRNRCCTICSVCHPSWNSVVRAGKRLIR